MAQFLQSIGSFALYDDTSESTDPGVSTSNQNRDRVKLLNVLDGDSIVVGDKNGNDRNIRLAGIDSNEVSHRQDPAKLRSKGSKDAYRKSDYSLALQRQNTADILNKSFQTWGDEEKAVQTLANEKHRENNEPLVPFTKIDAKYPLMNERNIQEQDMLDVGNMQRHQTLLDLTGHSDVKAPLLLKRFGEDSRFTLTRKQISALGQDIQLNVIKNLKSRELAEIYSENSDGSELNVTELQRSDNTRGVNRDVTQFKPQIPEYDTTLDEDAKNFVPLAVASWQSLIGSMINQGLDIISPKVLEETEAWQKVKGLTTAMADPDQWKEFMGVNTVREEAAGRAAQKIEALSKDANVSESKLIGLQIAHTLKYWDHYLGNSAGEIVFLGISMALSGGTASLGRSGLVSGLRDKIGNHMSGKITKSPGLWEKTKIGLGASVGTGLLAMNRTGKQYDSYKEKYGVEPTDSWVATAFTANFINYNLEKIVLKVAKPSTHIFNDLNPVATAASGLVVGAALEGIQEVSESKTEQALLDNEGSTNFTKEYNPANLNRKDLLTFTTAATLGGLVQTPLTVPSVIHDINERQKPGQFINKGNDVQEARKAAELDQSIPDREQSYLDRENEVLEILDEDFAGLEEVIIDDELEDGSVKSVPITAEDQLNYKKYVMSKFLTEIEGQNYNELFKSNEDKDELKSLVNSKLSEINTIEKLKLKAEEALADDSQSEQPITNITEALGKEATSDELIPEEIPEAKPFGPETEDSILNKELKELDDLMLSIEELSTGSVDTLVPEVDPGPREEFNQDNSGTTVTFGADKKSVPVQLNSDTQFTDNTLTGLSIAPETVSLTESTSTTSLTGGTSTTNTEKIDNIYDFQASVEDSISTLYNDDQGITDNSAKFREAIASIKTAQDQLSESNKNSKSVKDYLQRKFDKISHSITTQANIAKKALNDESTPPLKVTRLFNRNLKSFKKSVEGIIKETTLGADTKKKLDYELSGIVNKNGIQKSMTNVDGRLKRIVNLVSGSSSQTRSDVMGHLADLLTSVDTANSAEKGNLNYKNASAVSQSLTDTKKQLRSIYKNDKSNLAASTNLLRNTLGDLDKGAKESKSYDESTIQNYFDGVNNLLSKTDPYSLKQNNTNIVKSVRSILDSYTTGVKNARYTGARSTKLNLKHLNNLSILDDSLVKAGFNKSGTNLTQKKLMKDLQQPTQDSTWIRTQADTEIKAVKAEKKRPAKVLTLEEALQLGDAVYNEMHSKEVADIPVEVVKKTVKKVLKNTPKKITKRQIAVKVKEVAKLPVNEKIDITNLIFKEVEMKLGLEQKPEEKFTVKEITEITNNITLALPYNPQIKAETPISLRAKTAAVEQTMSKFSDQAAANKAKPKIEALVLKKYDQLQGNKEVTQKKDEVKGLTLRDVDDITNRIYEEMHPDNTSEIAEAIYNEMHPDTKEEKALAVVIKKQVKANIKAIVKYEQSNDTALVVSEQIAKSVENLKRISHQSTEDITTTRETSHKQKVKNAIKYLIELEEAQDKSADKIETKENKRIKLLLKNELLQNLKGEDYEQVDALIKASTSKYTVNAKLVRRALKKLSSIDVEPETTVETLRLTDKSAEILNDMTDDQQDILIGSIYDKMKVDNATQVNLFPVFVKNQIAEQVEIKKLVYKTKPEVAPVAKKALSEKEFGLLTGKIIREIRKDKDDLSSVKDNNDYQDDFTTEVTAQVEKAVKKKLVTEVAKSQARKPKVKKKVTPEATPVDENEVISDFDLGALLRDDVDSFSTEEIVEETAIPIPSDTPLESSLDLTSLLSDDIELPIIESDAISPHVVSAAELLSNDIFVIDGKSYTGQELDEFDAQHAKEEAELIESLEALNVEYEKITNDLPKGNKGNRAYSSGAGVVTVVANYIKDPKNSKYVNQHPTLQSTINEANDSIFKVMPIERLKQETMFTKALEWSKTHITQSKAGTLKTFSGTALNPYNLLDNPALSLLYKITVDKGNLRSVDYREDVAMAFGLVGLRFKALDVMSLKFNDVKTLQNLLGSNQSQFKPEAYSMGLPQSVVATGLGAEVVEILGISKKPNVNQETFDKLKASIGGMILQGLVSDNTIKDLSITKFDLDALINAKQENFQEETEVLTGVSVDETGDVAAIETAEEYEFQGQTTMVQPIEDYELPLEFYKKATISAASATLKSSAKKEPLLEPVETKDTEMAKRGVGHLNSVDLANLKGSREQAFKLDIETVDLMLNTLTRGELLRIQGYRSESEQITMSFDNKEAQKSINSDAERSYDSLIEFRKSTKADKKVYFNYFVGVVKRLTLSSNTINPQTDKLHRFLFIPTSNKKKYVKLKDTDKELIGFKYAIFQAFDGSPVGGSFAKLEQKDVIKNADILLNMNSEALLKYAKSVDHISHAYLAIANIKKYHEAKNSGANKFESTMLVEVDGTTNGFGHKLLQMPLKSLFNVWSKRVGLSDDSAHVDFGERLASGMTDAYETLSLVVAEKYDQSLVDNKFLQAIAPKVLNKDGSVSGAGRKLFKMPLMIYIYGAGAKTIATNQAEELIEDFVAKLAEMNPLGLTKKDISTVNDVFSVLSAVTPFDKASLGSLIHEIREASTYNIMLNGANKPLKLSTAIKLLKSSAYDQFTVQLEESLVALFGEFTPFNNSISTTTQVLFNIWEQTFDTTKRVRQAFKNKNAQKTIDIKLKAYDRTVAHNKINDTDATMKAVLAARKELLEAKQLAWTSKDEDLLFEELLPLFPGMNVDSNINGEELLKVSASQTAIFKRVQKTISERNTAKSEGGDIEASQIKLKSRDASEAGSIVVNHQSSKYTAAPSSALPFATQTQDAAGLTESIKKYDVLTVHDALVANVVDAEEMAYTQNEQFYNNNIDFNIIEALYNKLTTALDFLDTNQKSLFGSKANEIKSKILAEVDKFLLNTKAIPTDSIEKLVDTMDLQIAELKELKADMKQNLKVVAQFPFTPEATYKINKTTPNKGKKTSFGSSNIGFDNLYSIDTVKVEKQFINDPSVALNLLDELMVSSQIDLEPEYATQLKDVLQTFVSDNNLIPKLKVYLNETGVSSTTRGRFLSENISEQDENGNIRKVKKGVYLDVSNSASDNRLTQSPAEVYVHEMIHAATVYALRTDSAEKSKTVTELSRLYHQVMTKVTEQDLLSPNASADEQATARDLLSYLRDENGIAEFITHGLTNPAFSKYLKETSVKSLGPKGVFNKLFEAIIELFHSVFSKATYNESQFEALFELSQELSTINNKAAQENLDNTLTFDVSKTLETIDNKISDVIESMKSKVTNTTPNIPDIKDASLFQNIVQLTKLMVKSNTHPEYRGALEQALNKLGLSHNGTIQTVARTILDKDNLIATVAELKLLGIKVSQKQQRTITAIRRALTKQFNKTPSSAEQRAITSSLIETDAQYLLSSYSVDEIQRLLEDDNFRAEEVAKARIAIQDFPNLSNELKNYYLNQADSLAHYMVLNQGNEATNINVLSILQEEDYVGGISDKHMAIEKLSTLLALNLEKIHHPKSVRRTVNVMKREPKGIMALLTQHNSLIDQTTEDLPLLYKTKKGYIRHDYDPYAKVVIKPVSEAKELKKRGFTAETPTFHLVNGELQMYSNTNYTRDVYHRGAVSFNQDSNSEYTLSTKLKGSTNDKRFQQFGHELSAGKGERNRIKAIQYQGPVTFRPTGKIPMYNQYGHLENFRFVIDKDLLNARLNPDNKIINLMSEMFGELVDRVGRHSINQEAAQVLFEDAKNYDSIASKDNKDYIMLAPDSKDKELRKIYYMLPAFIRFKIEEETPNDIKFPVRADVATELFGYQAIKVPTQWMGPSFQKYGNLILDYWKETVKLTKSSIIIKMPEVLQNNVLSNFMTLLGNRVPISKIISYTQRGYADLARYRSDVKKIDSLRADLTLIADIPTNTNARNEIVKKINILTNTVKINKVFPLVQYGLYSSILEEYDETVNTTKSKPEQHLKNLGKFIPKPIKAVSDYILLTKNTKPHEVLSELTQSSDFIARYTLYYHELENKDTSAMLKNEIEEFKTDTIRHTSYSFINYSALSDKKIQFLEDMGLLMFTKFAIGSLYVIKKLWTTAPVTTMLTQVLQSVTGDVPDLHDTGLFSRDWTNLYHGPSDIIGIATTPGLFHALENY